MSFTGDTSIPQDKLFVIKCFLVGGSGRQWSTLPPLSRRQAGLGQIASMVGEENTHLVYAIEDVIEQEWIKESWGQGAPSPVKGPGLLNIYGKELRKPRKNVYFVSTETAFE